MLSCPVFMMISLASDPSYPLGLVDLPPSIVDGEGYYFIGMSKYSADNFYRLSGSMLQCGISVSQVMYTDRFQHRILDNPVKTLDGYVGSVLSRLYEQRQNLPRIISNYTT